MQITHLVIISVVICIVMEVFLRVGLKAHQPVLFQADETVGYYFKPNQAIYRLGKKNRYNQYSQRNDDIHYQKPKQTFRILMLGDSVLNGGSYTHQSQLISKFLKDCLWSQHKEVEVLNASCSSWGIGNQLGYLQKFGTFNSDIIILQIGTHDLVQLTSSGNVVGKLNHPDKPPFLALSFAFRRILFPAMVRFLQNKPYSALAEVPMPQNKLLQFNLNMEYLKAIIQLSKAAQIKTFVLFTPNREDLLPTSVNPLLKSEFLSILEKISVPVIDIHSHWLTLSPKELDNYYRDDVHLYPPANLSIAKKVARVIAPACGSL